MEVAGFFLLGQLLLAFIAIVGAVASFLTSIGSVGPHRRYRRVAMALAVFAGLLLLPMLALGGRVGFADYLVIFGPPIFTAMLCAFIISRARHARSA